MTPATLRKLEWRGTVTDPNGIDFYVACPLCKCGAKRPGETPKHAPDCELDAAIREAEQAEKGERPEIKVGDVLLWQDGASWRVDGLQTPVPQPGSRFLQGVVAIYRNPLWRQEPPTHD